MASLNRVCGFPGCAAAPVSAFEIWPAWYMGAPVSFESGTRGAANIEAKPPAVTRIVGANARQKSLACKLRFLNLHYQSLDQVGWLLFLARSFERSELLCRPLPVTHVPVNQAELVIRLGKSGLQLEAFLEFHDGFL